PARRSSASARISGPTQEPPRSASAIVMIAAGARAPDSRSSRPAAASLAGWQSIVVASRCAVAAPMRSQTRSQAERRRPAGIGSGARCQLDMIARMEYSNLGKTGLKVSRLCLGCMTYGSKKWRPWVLEEDEARPFFRRAIEAGIKFFDTADAYSVGVSETIVGRSLREYTRRDDVVIASKVFFPTGPGPNDQGLSRKHIVQALEASLRRLATDYIDLYQIHRLDPQTPFEET